MAKKKTAKEREHQAGDAPKFGGFKPFASNLGDLKAKLDADRRAVEDAAKAAGKKPPPIPVAAPRPAPPPKRTAATDREDELTFHRMMSGVTPLADRNQRVAVAGDTRLESRSMKPAEIAERAKEEAVQVLDHLHHLVDDVVRFEVIDDGKHVEGRRVDVLPNLLRELRRGTLPIDGRLDLHGLDAASARERLLEFLRAQRTRGERCVLVIHGKGENSPGGIGVLRGEIAAWLSQGRAREHVAAFATAREEDGGTGAVYVALRR